MGTLITVSTKVVVHKKPSLHRSLIHKIDFFYQNIKEI